MGQFVPYKNLDVDETGVLVQAGPRAIMWWYIYNNATSVRYLKLYNKATAPAVGTDVPVMTIPIPASSAANVPIPMGAAFPLGIGIGATTGVADADTGAPSANDVVVNLIYQ